VVAPGANKMSRQEQIHVMTTVLLLFLVITKNSKQLFVILERQYVSVKLWILFQFCWGPHRDDRPTLIRP
jgi:hypothetical protein